MENSVDHEIHIINMADMKLEGGELISSSSPPADDELKKQKRMMMMIPKVPRELRWKKENKGLFDPRVVSIGPYHHGAKPEYEEAEKLKSKAVDAFVAAGRKRGGRELYKYKMLEVVGDARKCYLPGSTDAYNDEAFAEMMLRDGCFVLYTFAESASEDLIHHLGYLGYNILFTDIILLENQLPFLILQTLINTKSLLLEDEDEDDEDKHKLEESIETIINLVYTRKKRDQHYKQESRELPFHFLQLVRKRFLMRRRRRRLQQESDDHQPSQTRPRPRPPPPRQSTSSKRWPRSAGQDWEEELKATFDNVFKHIFRSATELKAKGIHFKASTTFRLNDLSFTTPLSLYGYAQLTLPQVSLDSGTKYLFLNMMAYELAPPFDDVEKNLEVCGYIYFMNSLINGAEDVMELRSHNIIHNFLGNDEDVAKAFNTMAYSALPPVPGTIADVTSDQIQQHYNSKRKTWMAQLLHTYFTSPWAAVAFFAAILGLVFTFISTFFPRST